MPAPTPRIVPALALAVLLSACAIDDGPTGPLRTIVPSTNQIASQFHVTSTADDGSDGTLRKELADAASGDTVTIDPSLAGQTITLGVSGLGIAKTITILGPGPQGVTIDAGGDSRVIGVGAAGSLVMKDVTLTGGEAVEGGGLWLEGDVTLERVVVTGNTATAEGGGIFVNGDLTLIDSKVLNNRANYGGGIYTLDPSATITISRSTVAGNTTVVFGGKGGGIATKSRLDIDHSTISGNTSTFGGGIYVYEGTTTLVNSTVSGNDAENNGGGIYAFDGAVELTHSTVTANYSSAGGGLLWDSGADISFTSSIIAGNTEGGTDHANCWIDGNPDYAGTNVSNDTSCGAASATMLIVDPNLGPLADNGGPTKTHALLLGSPVVDAVASCIVSDDQRGVTRPQGPKCDPGAVEFDAFVVPALTIDPSGTTNQKTGVAVVSGTQACSFQSQLTLRVTVTQSQRVRKVSTQVTGSADVIVNCDAAQVWGAAVQPATGAFNNSPANVTVQVIAHPAWVAPATANAPSVIMAWSRR